MSASETGQLNVLLVQADLAWAAPQRNRDHLEALIDTQGGRADLVVFPETFTTGFLGDHASEPEAMNGETMSWMQSLARRHRAVICGSVALQDGGRRNRFLWVSPDGPVQFYDKKHLFSFGGEDQQYSAGQQQVTFTMGDWRIRPQVCYDIRFPVWCRNRNDYDLLLVVANWPATRIDAWTALLRARAIENQCYVVAVNRTGEDGKGIRYNGHSVVFEPTGKTLLESGEPEGVCLVALDLQQVRKLRRKYPFQDDADDFTLLA
ncbi:MAG: amidohydrolase [Xanthomonadales bacterium]|nr:amidohydrolase [Xanthomonadales bacterium]